MSDSKNDTPSNLSLFHKSIKKIERCLKERQLIRDSAYTTGAQIPTAENRKNSRFNIYVGFDPTAPSLHLGHYIQIQTLLRLNKEEGFNVFALVGEATAKIGDPSGRTTLRPTITDTTVARNASKIAKQLRNFELRVVNNKKFYENKKLLDFLQTVGSKINVNLMLNKDTTQKRLATGLTFQEFAYQTLQAYDFYKMYKTKGVACQIGGSDQWGNITGGLNLIHKMCGSQTRVAGFTTPLLVDEKGLKFGKTSDGKTLWLDKNLTNPFVLYQHLRTLSDRNAFMLLLWLSNKPVKQILKTREQHLDNPAKNKMQIELAAEVVKNIHGEQAARRVSRLTALLFNETPDYNLFKKELGKLAEFFPNLRRKTMSLKDFLVETKLASSKREATEFIVGGAISVNQNCVRDAEHILDLSSSHENHQLVQRGKNQFALMLKPKPRKKRTTVRKN